MTKASCFSQGAWRVLGGVPTYGASQLVEELGTMYMPRAVYYVF